MDIKLPTKWKNTKDGIDSAFVLCDIYVKENMFDDQFWRKILKQKCIWIISYISVQLNIGEKIRVYT